MFNPLFVNPLFVCLLHSCACVNRGWFVGLFGICGCCLGREQNQTTGQRWAERVTPGASLGPERVRRTYTCFNSVLYSYFTFFFYMYSYSSTCSFPCGTTVVDPCPRLDGPGVGTIMKAVETERRQESPPEERPEERPEDQVQEEQDEITKI